MAYRQGVKFLKISKTDALGNDKSTILNQLKNIRIKYSDVGIVQYDVSNKTEYPTYFLYQVDYKDAVSTVDRGVQNYILDAAGLQVPGGANLFGDYRQITDYNNTTVSNDHFDEGQGFYTIKETEHYPNVVITYTASVDYQANGSYPIYPILILATGDLAPGTVVKQLTPGSVSSPGTITISGSFPVVDPQNINYFLVVSASDEGLNRPIDFQGFTFKVSQSIAPTAYDPLLVVPSPDTTLKFEGTDCDVTYGWVDRYPRSQYYMDIDYTTGLTIPTNQLALVSGTAPTAPVKDYYYTLQAHTKPRYQGSRVSQLYLNKYTGPSTTLIVNGSPYQGDTGYGKSPNVESRRAYVGWFTDVRGATPEFNNAVNINVRYLIDKAGDTYSPQLTKYFLNELRGVFTDGEILNLNFVDNIAGTNSTPNTIKSQLNGERIIIRSGARPVAILYSQTGSGADAYTSSISFVAGGGVQPQVVTKDFRFGAVSQSSQIFTQNTDTNLQFPQENWDFSNSYTASTGQYTFHQTPTSDIEFVTILRNLTPRVLYLSNNKDQTTKTAAQIKILKNSQFLAGQRVEMTPTQGFTELYVGSGYQQFTQGDVVTVQLYTEPNGKYSSPLQVGVTEFVMNQRSISQYALSSSAPVVSPYLLTSSAGTSIITASSQFKSYLGFGVQTPITESGFDSTSIPLTFNVGDQFRFENDEGKTYSIAKIISSSAQTPNGEVYIQLDRSITPGTKINYFVLRRFIDDPTNILVQGIKGSGGTGPGSIKALATTQELEDNLPTIITRLNSENAI